MICHQPSPRPLAALALVFGTAMATALGCGDSRVEVVPVSGTVTFNGQPPVGGQIVLHPLDRSQPSEVAPSAAIRADGSFSISAYESGDGAPPGEYVATVQWFKYDPELGGPGANAIPKEYTSEKTSPIRVKVDQAPTTVPPIAIRSGGAPRR